jgi:hypothetical protein
LDKAAGAKVKFEISQIDKLIVSSEPLLKLCQLKTPDFIETSAAAMLLHSFYSGIENTLLLIFKGTGKQLPNSSKWHTELLDMAFASDETGKTIFRRELSETLNDYLKFRHFVRHSYGFQLDWARMENLTENLVDTWEMAKSDFEKYIGFEKEHQG